MSIYDVFNIILRILHKLSHPPSDPMGEYNHYRHLKDEETEA